MADSEKTGAAPPLHTKWRESSERPRCVETHQHSPGDRDSVHVQALQVETETEHQLLVRDGKVVTTSQMMEENSVSGL